jgi:hypothetical protein
MNGSADERAEGERRVEAAKRVREAASTPALARRATFAASETGKAALFGDRELVEDVAAGRIELDEVAPEALPAPFQGLAPSARAAKITEIAEERAELRQQLRAAAAKRDAHLRAEIEARGGAEGSLDQQLYDTVRKQTRDLGLDYAGDGPAY